MLLMWSILWLITHNEHLQSIRMILSCYLACAHINLHILNLQDFNLEAQISSEMQEH